MGTLLLRFQQLINGLPSLNIGVPALKLTADQRQQIKISEHCLERFNKNKIDFVRRFITMGEAWIHHYTPQSKQQSKQPTEAGCSAPKKTRSVP